MKYIILLLLTIFFGCHPFPKCENDLLLVKNNSPKTLYILAGFFGEAPDDTTISNSYDGRTTEFFMTSQSEPSKVRPMGENDAFLNYSNNGLLCLRHTFYYDSTNSIQIFLIDSATISDLSWDTVRKYNKIEKRFFMTLEDLDYVDWTIVYP